MHSHGKLRKAETLLGQADSVALGIYLWDQGNRASEAMRLILAVRVTMNKSRGLSEPEFCHL